MYKQSVALNFLVCKTLHETRTKPLYEEICKPFLDKHGERSGVYLFGGFDQFDDIPIIRVTEADDYLSCIEKVLKLLEYHSNLNHDWYFIGDDDTFINLPKFESLLNTLDGEKLAMYGYVVYTTRLEPPMILHAHGGAGTIFNKKTLKVLLEFIAAKGFDRHHRHGDVSLARTIKNYNDSCEKEKCIEFVNIKEMHGPYEKLTRIDVKNSVCIHVKDRISFKSLKEMAL